MKEIVATVTSKGQITIPVKVRKHLGVSTQSKLAFVIDNDGNVRVRHAEFPDIDSLRDAAGKLDQPLSWDAMRQIARDEYLTRKYGRGGD
jgi:AbrB family looped-hinge helix DNA binding protein